MSLTKNLKLLVAAFTTLVMAHADKVDVATALLHEKKKRERFGLLVSMLRQLNEFSGGKVFPETVQEEPLFRWLNKEMQKCNGCKNAAKCARRPQPTCPAEPPAPQQCDAPAPPPAPTSEEQESLPDELKDLDVEQDKDDLDKMFATLRGYNWPGYAELAKACVSQQPVISIAG